MFFHRRISTNLVLRGTDKIHRIRAFTRGHYPLRPALEITTVASTSQTGSKNVSKPGLVLQPVPLRLWELRPPFCQLPGLRTQHQGPRHAAHLVLPADLRLAASVSRPRRASRLAPGRHGQLELHAQQPPPSTRLLVLSQSTRQRQHRPGCDLSEPAGFGKRRSSGSVRRSPGALGRRLLFQPVRVHESGDGDVLLDAGTLRERSDQPAGTARKVQSG